MEHPAQEVFVGLRAVLALNAEFSELLPRDGKNETAQGRMAMAFSVFPFKLDLEEEVEAGVLGDLHEQLPPLFLILAQVSESLDALLVD